MNGSGAITPSEPLSMLLRAVALASDARVEQRNGWDVGSKRRSD